MQVDKCSIKILFIQNINITQLIYLICQQMINARNHISLQRILNCAILDHRVPKSIVQNIDLTQLLHSDLQITQIKTKGLLLQICAHILLRQFSLFNVDLGAFVDGINPQTNTKKQVTRNRPRNTNPKSRKQSKKKNLKEAIRQIEALSEESISNPKNVIEQQRVINNSGLNKHLQIGQFENELSNKDSNSSLQSAPTDFRKQLDKVVNQANSRDFNLMVTQDVGPNFRDLLTQGEDINQEAPLNLDLQADENSNKSSKSDELISNLAEKMKLLFPQEKEDKRTKRKEALETKRKRRDGMVTKKKYDHHIIDSFTTFVEKSRIQNETLNNISNLSNLLELNQTKRRVQIPIDDSIQIPEFTIGHQKVFQSFQIEKFKIFSAQKKNLSNIQFKFTNQIPLNQNSAILNQNQQENLYDLNTGPEVFDAQISVHKQSEKNSSNTNSRDSFKDHPILKRLRKKDTVQELSKRTKTNKAYIFYQLLELTTTKHLALEQTSPQAFAPINILIL